MVPPPAGAFLVSMSDRRPGRRAPLTQTSTPILKIHTILRIPGAVVAQVIADEDMARAQEAQFAPSAVGP